MQRNIAVRAFLILLAVATAAAGAAADFEWNGAVASGQAVKIQGINGDIRAEGAESNQVQVTATKSGRDADQVRVEAEEHDGGVTVKAIYPKNTKGRFEASVSFTVRVPNGVRFVGHTVNGDIETVDLDSEVDATTVNGSVRVSTSQRATAKTVNGSVEAHVTESGLREPLELESVNGRIRVNVPAGLDADVEARTVHGDIETDLPMTVKGKWGMHSMSGRIGAGGPKLAMRTVNGRIELRQAEQ